MHSLIHEASLREVEEIRQQIFHIKGKDAVSAWNGSFGRSWGILKRAIWTEGSNSGCGSQDGSGERRLRELSGRMLTEGHAGPRTRGDTGEDPGAGDRVYAAGIRDVCQEELAR